MPIQKKSALQFVEHCGGYIFNASRFFDMPTKHFLPYCPGIAAFFECERNLLTLKINNHSKFSFLKEKIFVFYTCQFPCYRL